MKLDIVTPEGALFSGEVDSIIVPGVNGAFEMLNNHAPIIAILGEGDIRIKGSNILIDTEVQDKFKITTGEAVLPIKSGTVEMKNNKVIVLAE
jgi:F-type H+-transporting ATPase subunit epsilon